ncbi:sugar transferase [Cyanobacteria bacterium FACHB-471]|nr:sugar transferase [Cyanobacteria bacterium FACHB-471]
MDGICTLANDYVYDQLVALLNSIEAIAGSEMPVCVYPYDNKTERIAAEIARRPNVQLYDDQDSIQHWDQYVCKIWDAHPTARDRWQKAGYEPYHRVGTHRRFCAFDGPFDRFLYMDADTLLMSPVKPIFEQLNNADWVVYDFQHKDPSHVYDLSSKKLKQVFPQERIKSEIFCSGFYASKRNVFSPEMQSWLLTKLRDGEAGILYDMAPDQTILNYMVMRSGISSYNFSLRLPAEARTGCCVTSQNFSEQDHLLYDRGNRLTYIHYIGLKSKHFARLCQGENVNFPYQDLFLHYRFLHEPEKKPVLVDVSRPQKSSPNLKKRVLRKLGLSY